MAENKSLVSEFDVEKRALYEEDEILTLEFDEGVAIECGIMGIFELDGKDYIALDSLEEGSIDIYLYNYVEVGDDFDLVDIPEEDLERVFEAFERLMEEPI